jgi:hypothetical protein
VYEPNRQGLPVIGRQAATKRRARRTLPLGERIWPTQRTECSVARTPHPVKHPKRTVAALATGLAAIGVAIGSGADFTARSSNAPTMFAAGTLRIENSDEGTSVFDTGFMTPGGPAATGTVDIRNAGNIPAGFTLSRAHVDHHDAGEPSATPMAAKLGLTIVDCGAFDEEEPPHCGDADDEPVYDGTLAGMSSPLGLGRFIPWEKHRYEVAVRLDESAGNEYQGDWTQAGFVWDAVSADH